MRVLLPLALLCLMVLAVSCGSESSTESTRPTSSPAPTARESTSQTEVAAKGATAPGTASLPSVSSGGGQQTLASESVRSIDIKSVILVPERPVAGDQINVKVDFDKPEQASVPLHYQWRVNGEAVQHADRDTLEYHPKRGDVVEVAVFVGNQREEAQARRAKVEVDNSPPAVKKIEDHMGANGEYVARLETSDPDGDAVALKLQQGPMGMILDQDSKEIRWPVPAGANGDFTVEVLASDPAGASAVLSYAITIRQEQGTAGSTGNATSISPPPK